MERQVLVPLSLTPALTATKLAVARHQTRVYDAQLVLLHVLPAGAFEAAHASPAEATARAYLDSVAAQLRAEGTPAHALVRAGPTAATILQAAQEGDVCLIVLGSTTRPRLPRALLGSVADTVIHAATCPVLLVRPTRDFDPTPGLLPLDPFDLLAPYPLGHRLVDVVRIVGSATRAQELGPDFRPLRNTPADEQRFQSILAGLVRGETLPPVELYKLGFGYYVRDGHHRVAAARAVGRHEIEATVIELLAVDDAEAQRAFLARREFEVVTGLTRIGAQRSETYARLRMEIDSFGAGEGIGDPKEAARRWHAEVYRPLWRRVRALGLLRYCPGERTTDVIARMAAWRDSETELHGATPSWEEALAGLPLTASGSSRGGRTASTR